MWGDLVCGATRPNSIITVSRSEKQIEISSFNTHSLRNKIDELRYLVLTENIDVIAVTETFIDMVNNVLIHEYSIEGLKFFNKYRINRRGDGVALFIATWPKPVEISPNDTDLEHVYVKLNGDKLAGMCYSQLTHRASESLNPSMGEPPQARGETLGPFI